MTFAATPVQTIPSAFFIPNAGTNNVGSSGPINLSSSVNSGSIIPSTQYQTVYPDTSKTSAQSSPISTGVTNTDSSQLSLPNQTSSSSGVSSLTSGDLSYLSNQASQLQDLLNRTQTGLDQGLQANDSAYNQNVNDANDQKAQQYNTYANDRTTQTKNKLSAYDTINQNANQGYNSLAQLIGRAGGTNSSAYQELLPNVIGTDTSNKRAAASSTFGSNLANIQNSQDNYDLGFQRTLDDLANQKKSNEDTLRSGIETQRQSINQQLEDNAAQVAEANGGGAAAVAAAEAPYQQNITNSRNAVDSFFSQFQPTYTTQQAVATPVNLADYTTDRSVLNAQSDPTTADNPYAALLQKKLQQTNAS